MAAIIAFMISIGVITCSEEATQELIDEYQPQYEQHIIIEDMSEF
jgi:hypothetical protein